MADDALFSRYLPEDLISNILVRLPIRSLLVCTSISKPWNFFIKSSAFISSHLNHKKNDSDLCLLQICPVPFDTGTTDSFFLRLKDREMSEYDRLQFPFPSHRSGYQVVSSCNGIVYFTHGRFYHSSYDAQWILWNPAIKKTMVITECHNARALEASGLGFDSKTGDFKVLSIIEEAHRNDNLMVHLYSLKANSWKRLPDIDFVNMKDLSMHREMAFVNGVLHFVGLRSLGREPRFVILAFDLADESFHEIMLPDSNRFSEYIISAHGESLSVLWLKDGSMSNMEIWVMKEYGVEGSWTKVSTIKFDILKYCGTNSSFSGFVFVDDSHVLLSVSSYFYPDTVGMIFLHDLKSQETKEIEIGGENTYCYLGNYVESLVLLDVANDQKPSEVESDDGSDEIDSANEGNADLEEDSDEFDSSFQPSDEQRV